MLGRPESLVQGELDVSMDAVGRHLLVYTGSHRVRMMNLATGQLASVRVAQIPSWTPPSAPPPGEHPTP
jgi:hypothetical protein